MATDMDKIREGFKNLELAGEKLRAEARTPRLGEARLLEHDLQCAIHFAPQREWDQMFKETEEAVDRIMEGATDEERAEFKAWQEDFWRDD